MTRIVSYANETWLGDTLVLRINHRGVGRLAREARIVSALPREALYPEVVTVGHDDEIEWMLVRRVPGIDLGRAWMSMTPVEREHAIHQLAAALAAVHGTPIEGIPDDDFRPQPAFRPPHTLPLGPLLELIDEVIGPHDPAIVELATEFVTQRWSAFDDADRGLVHGDPHLENVLWDGQRVSALLDLEWSRPSWSHADLEILLAVADSPRLFAAADYDASIDPSTFTEMPRWLAAARPDWFAHPRIVERLEVLYLSRTLGCFEDDADAASFRWDHVAATLAGESFIQRPTWRSI